MLPVFDMAEPPVFWYGAAINSGFTQQNVGVADVLVQSFQGVL